MIVCAIKAKGMPGVIGLTDGTFVQIKGTSRDEHAFVNRKGQHSINVQVEFI